MRIDKCSIEEVYKCGNLHKDDVILYLGGRIDDDALYPPKYIKYLRDKIKRLKPTKIICHNHWYAKKYYEKGILTKNTKIDIIFVYYNYLSSVSRIQAINPVEYNRSHLSYIKVLTNKNPNIIWATYISEGLIPNAINVFPEHAKKNFGEHYDLTKIKYFSYSRAYTPNVLAPELNYGTSQINASDGFAMVSKLSSAGFRNINILGFSAFGSEEDLSYHSVYDCEGDNRFYGRKYFNVNTSENLRVESDILKHWSQTGKIKNVEKHSKLMTSLEEV